MSYICCIVSFLLLCQRSVDYIRVGLYLGSLFCFTDLSILLPIPHCLISLKPKLFYLCLVIQSCPTLCDPMDCSPPGSSVHGVPQPRILEWVAMLSSRGSSQSRVRTQVSHIAGIFRRLSHQGSPKLQETVRM